MKKLEVYAIEIGEDGNIYETKYFERMSEMFGNDFAKEYIEKLDAITTSMSERMEVKLKQYESDMNKLVEVCDKCLKASCWYGEFWCEDSHSAGTKLMTVLELESKNLENSEYWSDEYMKKMYGNSNPFGYKGD
jgi:hypothetical protein